ncbi:hypothetical protein SOVF_164010 [Spinacia oleracea]|nr:hypothetical protein SOVF_164010 [Spinacia oleracea]
MKPVTLAPHTSFLRSHQHEHHPLALHPEDHTPSEILLDLASQQQPVREIQFKLNNVQTFPSKIRLIAS